LQRKKDHQGVRLGGSNNNSRLIKAYYITSQDKLDIHKEEMITLANVFNARVSINLNPRNFEKAAYHLLQKIANQMSNKDFRGVSKAYDSICGEYHSEIDRRWIIDIDAEDMHRVSEIRERIAELHKMVGDENSKGYKIIAEIPSKTGMHIIANPFNVSIFAKLYPGITLHKNNPTSLYIP
jgi:hypothetical protein